MREELDKPVTQMQIAAPGMSATMRLILSFLIFNNLDIVPSLISAMIKVRDPNFI
jgi:hypothetical protein